MRTVIVTGGAGFIGFNYVRELLAAEPDTGVVILDKMTYAGNPVSLAELAGERRLELVRGDIGDRPLVRALLARTTPDAIVHFAAESHVDRSISALPDTSRALYSDLIISSLPRLARQILEAQMEGYKYRSDYARKYFGQGLCAAVLVLAADKLGTLPEDIEARIRGLADHEILTALNRELGRARDAAEALAVIDRHTLAA